MNSNPPVIFFNSPAMGFRMALEWKSLVGSGITIPTFLLEKALWFFLKKVLMEVCREEMGMPG